MILLTDAVATNDEAKTVAAACRAVADVYRHLPSPGVHDVLDHRMRAEILTKVADRIDAAVEAELAEEAADREARKKAERLAERARRKADREAVS